MVETKVVETTERERNTERQKAGQIRVNMVHFAGGSRGRSKLVLIIAI